MKIAILSDIHDHVWNLKKALDVPKLQATDAMLCCGDLCAPFIIKLLGQGYAKPIHLVFGNNDGDVDAIIANAQHFSNIQIHGETFHGVLGGRRIAMNHYPDSAKILAEQGGYEVVCYGHDHTLVPDMWLDRTLLINPGPIMGYHGGQLKDIPATFLVLDTDTLQTEVYTL
jgi:hypothetical protein